jgi:hypothetical protein
MSKRETIHKELGALVEEGTKLNVSFQKKKGKRFNYDYQSWYTKALKAVASLAPDRHMEFRSYYEINPKRKNLHHENYVIQDYFKGVHLIDFSGYNERDQVLTCFLNQLAILKSIEARIDSIFENIEGELYAELQENEIAVARQLVKVSLRAAGALVGVVIEGHLQKVALSHGVKLTKKNPTISDLIDPLKAASIIDTSTWRKIFYLADLRNLCSHKKNTEPTKEQVEELITGAEWVTMNVF